MSWCLYYFLLRATLSSLPSSTLSHPGRQIFCELRTPALISGWLCRSWPTGGASRRCLPCLVLQEHIHQRYRSSTVLIVLGPSNPMIFLTAPSALIPGHVDSTLGAYLSLNGSSLDMLEGAVSYRDSHWPLSSHLGVEKTRMICTSPTSCFLIPKSAFLPHDFRVHFTTGLTFSQRQVDLLPASGLPGFDRRSEILIK